LCSLPFAVSSYGFSAMHKKKKKLRFCGSRVVAFLSAMEEFVNFVNRVVKLLHDILHRIGLHCREKIGFCERFAFSLPFIGNKIKISCPQSSIAELDIQCETQTMNFVWTLITAPFILKYNV
jgi:hypothetical protein